MVERRRSRTLIALIAGAAVVVILMVTGLYLVAFRSLPTTVLWALSASSITPGGDLTISGRITPAESGRQVVFQGAPTEQGPWKPIHPATTTDGSGQFALTFTPQLSASTVLRVVVDPFGRYLAATGVAVPVRLLSLSTISIKGGGVISTPNPLTFTLAVEPTSARRTVRIEQSKDKVHWAPVGQPTQTKAEGTAVTKVPRPAPGVWSYRATVAQDGMFAAAVSPLVGATVEDMKVVEARAAAAHAKAVAGERARQDRAAADAQAAKKAASDGASGSSKPNCPVNQGPVSGNWCRHSANGPDNPGYVKQCEIPGVPKYQWPDAVNGKC